jgi:predicted kinase
MVLHLPHQAMLMLCGPPGVGKTTWARQRAAGRHVDLDTLRVQRGSFDEPASFDVAIDMMLTRARALLAEGGAVVEHVGVNVPLSQALADLAAEMRAPVHVLWLEEPRDVWQAGQQQRGRILPADVNDHYAQQLTGAPDRLRTQCRPASMTVMNRQAAGQVTAVKFTAADGHVRRGASG